MSKPRQPVSWFDAADAPDWEKLRSCVHCGMCLPACPTYRELKIEADSPRGRLYLMRALHEGRLEMSEEVRAHLDLCLVCRACETACPSGVPFGALMESTRGQVERRLPRTGARAWIEDRVFRDLLPSRRRLEWLALGLRFYQRAGLRAFLRGSGLLRLLPARLREAEALLPAVPPASRRRALLAITPAAASPPKARVGFLVTCVMRILQPDVNRATTGLLAKAGAEVRIARLQTCCGALHAHAGRREEAKALARKNIAAMESLGPLDYLVSNASGCGASLREYGHWLAEDPEWAGRAAALAAKVRDVTEVLAELGLPAPVDPGRSRVAVHDPCHLAHGQRVRSAPRELLKAAGYDVRDLENSDYCCGSAGIYNLLQPEMAEVLLERKLDTVRKAGAEYVAVANPGCLMHMERGARARRLPSRMVHPLLLLARAHGIGLENGG